MNRTRIPRKKNLWSIAGIVVAIVIALVWIALANGGENNEEDLLSELRQELIPLEGSATDYGIPYSLSSLPQFVEWWVTLVPEVENDPRYIESLSALVAPCCDDNPAYSCCCEGEEGQACNIIRSGKGLAAHLIHDLDYPLDQVQASVLDWFRFARPDYYLAVALQEQGVSPKRHDLTDRGSCYRGMCNTAVSLGGCGGMNELIEPALYDADT